MNTKSSIFTSGVATRENTTFGVHECSFFETVKSKVIISLFETVKLSVSISPRNLYNSLKSIKEI